MENPKCPYCGGEMEYQDQWIYPFYICLDCYSQSPRTMEIKSQEEAYAAAMKRDGEKGKAKGERIWNTHEGWECCCSRCGEPLPLLTDDNDEFICKANYCPNCGAEMEEVNDE